jgi:hypothetical protein
MACATSSTLASEDCAQPSWTSPPDPETAIQRPLQLPSGCYPGPADHIRDLEEQVRVAHEEIRKLAAFNTELLEERERLKAQLARMRFPPVEDDEVTQPERLNG